MPRFPVGWAIKQKNENICVGFEILFYAVHDGLIFIL